MNGNSSSVNFLYGTRFGRLILKAIMKLHMDRPIIVFLKSPMSKPMIRSYIRKNNIEISKESVKTFHSFRDFFARKRENITFDEVAEHLISPCDSSLSVFDIDENSQFHIKGSYYKVKDFLHDEELAKNYIGGTCLVFRLCVSDYHHYCYIDSGYQGKNNYIAGVLHSVQPIACEKFPVFVLNKRCWCLLETDHFGPVVQCEIGALVVGGIANDKEEYRFRKGEEKGHFELSGSTVVLLFEKGRISLDTELSKQLTDTEEVKVFIGECIGKAL